MTNIAEPSACPEEGHGLMVPCRWDFALVKHSIVEGIVSWDKSDDKMVAQGYAPSREAFDALAMLDEPRGLGGRIYQLQQQGSLVDYRDVARGFSAVYRIDDRTANNRVYMIRVGRQLDRGPGLKRGVVYHYFGDEAEEHAAPPLTRFDDVRALMSDPNRLLIMDTHGLAGKTTDDEEVKARFSLENRIVVWDIGAIYRNDVQRKAEDAESDN